MTDRTPDTFHGIRGSLLHECFICRSHSRNRHPDRPDSGSGSSVPAADAASAAPAAAGGSGSAGGDSSDSAALPWVTPFLRTQAIRFPHTTGAVQFVRHDGNGSTAKSCFRRHSQFARLRSADTRQFLEKQKSVSHLWNTHSLFLFAGKSVA